jgi:hypothetical protein
MNFKIIWERISRYFSCFKNKHNNKPQLNIDDILESEYERLHDPETQIMFN